MEKPWWILVGASRRLGRELALDLGRDHALVLTRSRIQDPEPEWMHTLSKRTQVRTLCWNAADPRLVPTMMADLEALRSEGVRLAGAVVVAGTFPRQPLGTWDPAILATTWQVNLSFPLLVAQALAQTLEEGACLQLLLDTAIHRPMAERLPYSAAKAALGNLVPGLARSLAPRLRVVGHALGVVLPDDESDPDLLARLNLLKRNGRPEDLARALRYASASPYLTGDILTLDGGRRWA